MLSVAVGGVTTFFLFRCSSYFNQYNGKTSHMTYTEKNISQMKITIFCECKARVLYYIVLSFLNCHTFRSVTCIFTLF